MCTILYFTRRHCYQLANANFFAELHPQSRQATVPTTLGLFLPALPCKTWPRSRPYLAYATPQNMFLLTRNGVTQVNVSGQL